MQSHIEKSHTAKINDIIISARSRSVICIRLALGSYIFIYSYLNKVAVTRDLKSHYYNSYIATITVLQAGFVL